MLAGRDRHPILHARIRILRFEVWRIDLQIEAIDPAISRVRQPALNKPVDEMFKLRNRAMTGNHRILLSGNAQPAQSWIIGQWCDYSSPVGNTCFGVIVTYIENTNPNPRTGISYALGKALPQPGNAGFEVRISSIEPCNFSKDPHKLKCRTCLNPYLHHSLQDRAVTVRSQRCAHADAFPPLSVLARRAAIHLPETAAEADF